MAEIKTTKIEAEKTLSKKKALALFMRYFKILPPVLIMIILILGYFILIKPKYNKVRNEIETAIRQKEDNYQTYENYFNKLNDLKRVYNKVDANNLQKINHLLPSEPEVEEILVQLESIVLRNGLLLSSVELDWEKAEPQKESRKSAALRQNSEEGEMPQEIGRIRATLEVAGTDYTALKNLLKTLENNLRLIDVEGIEFFPGSDTVTLTMSSYYLKL